MPCSTTRTNVSWQNACPTNNREDSHFRTLNVPCAICFRLSLQYYILICAQPSKPLSSTHTFPDRNFVNSLHFCNSLYISVHISLIYYLIPIMLDGEVQIMTVHIM